MVKRERQEYAISLCPDQKCQDLRNAKKVQETALKAVLRQPIDRQPANSKA